VPLQHIHFPPDGSAEWAGMGDFVLESPDGSHRIELIYEGEPPHGDSYHQGKVDGRPFPGLVWGCLFAFSSCSNYAVFSWMPQKFERHTVVVDLSGKRYFVLPNYIHKFKVLWPEILGEGDSEGRRFAFSGAEAWKQY
jgi:hypothetical protein